MAATVADFVREESLAGNRNLIKIWKPALPFREGFLFWIGSKVEGFKVESALSFELLNP